MSVEAATTALAAAKAAHKANKADKALKAAYKAAKAALAEATAAAEAKAAKKAAKKSKKRKAESAPAPVTLESLQAAAAEAKTAHKANKADAALKAAYKAAKQAVKDFEAAPAAAATEEAPADDLLAGLKKKTKTEDTSGGNASLSGPPPSADHEGNPPAEKIFAGNLSFDIDDDSCKEWFADCGAITDIYWLEDRDSGKFKGCGFITFESLEAAAKAVAKNGQDCMGREIRLNYAQNKGGGQKKSFGGSKPLSEKPEGCTTVFAGNLSYEIDDDKMREFAADCGDVKNIRWLTDRDSGEFKGCGFIEFFDGNGVDAFVKKNGNDLLGRSIRLDYAAPRAPKEW